MSKRKGIIPSVETRAKRSASLMGHPISDKTRAIWSAQRMGNKYALGRKHTPEAKEKDRQAHLGKPLKPETIVLFRDGRRKGVNNAHWKGGTSSLPHLLRTSFQYRQWRSDIFTRDSFTCMICGDHRGGNLHAHHRPKSFLKIIEEYKIETIAQALPCESLWDINNGMTLCDECHHQIHLKSRAG